MPDFIDRLSSLDSGYKTGDLSVYPVAIDDRNQLYEVRNNAVTVLAQTLGYTSRFLVVADTSLFPVAGLLKVGEEIIYYGEKTDRSFRQLKRGFAGSRQGQWPSGSEVFNAVFADPHNAVKDAVINLEQTVGLEENPAAGSLNAILQDLERRFLAPKPVFRALPSRGVPPLEVTFQNFSDCNPIRVLWDFGDGGTSIENAPTHTYLSEGNYTVRLNLINELGAQGIATKTDYIKVSNDFSPQFFYATPMTGAAGSTFSFVDQTLNVSSRNWIFDDGGRESQSDPDIHYTTHVYDVAGTYRPVLILVTLSNKLVRLQLPEPIIVT